jgi:SAM-dependent methyltransferase
VAIHLPAIPQFLGTSRYRLSPGHILQFSYLEERLKKGAHRSFIEMGSGNGMVSNCLLTLGLKGSAYDLNASACENNGELNRVYLEKGMYRILNENFIDAKVVEKVDIVISSMVLEHLPEDVIQRYFEKCKQVLNPNGVVVTLVPGSPEHWGIEDEIAGHLRRYSRESLRHISNDRDLTTRHIAGLTYPLSNFLYPISNWIVRRHESHKLSQSMLSRTIESGNREVPFKTIYPNFTKLLINRFTLFPFILFQKLFRNHSRALVLYSEISVSKP